MKRFSYRIAKSKPVCQACCRVCSSGSSVHIKCIEEFLLKNGLLIIAHPLEKQELIL